MEELTLVGVKMNKALLTRLDKQREEEQTTRSAVVRKALRAYLEERARMKRVYARLQREANLPPSPLPAGKGSEPIEAAG